MSNTPPLDDLWADLKTAASGSASASIARPTETVVRRVPLADKLLGACLNGFVPALLALSLGCLVGSREASHLFPQGSTFSWGLLAGGLVAVLPLAWLTSCWWGVDKVSRSRLPALVFATAGVGLLAMAVPFSGAAAFFTPVSTESVVQMLQTLYNSYLSWPSVAVFVTAGLLFGLSLSRLRRTAPWLETVQRVSGARRLAALLLLLSPWLLLGLSALSRGRIAPNPKWVEYIYSSAPPLGQESDQAWSRLVLDVEADPALRAVVETDLVFQAIIDPPRPRLPDGKADGIASRLVSLLPELPRQNARRAASLISVVLDHRDELEHRDSLAWGLFEAVLLLETHSFSHYWEILANRALEEILFPTWLAPAISVDEAKTEIRRLDTLEAKFAPPQQTMETILWQVLHSEILDPRSGPPRPLVAFGLELPFSPERTLAEIRYRQYFHRWETLKANLDWSSYETLGRSLEAEAPPAGQKRDPIFYAASFSSRHLYTLLYRTHLQSARLILLLRLHKLQSGRYPDQLHRLELPPEIDVNNWTYSVKGDDQALLSTKLAFKPGAVSWTLP